MTRSLYTSAGHKVNGAGSINEWWRAPGSTNTEWIAKLVDTAESAEHLLTTWEIVFLEGWDHRLRLYDELRVSPKQLAILERIAQKLDRETW